MAPMVVVVREAELRPALFLLNNRQRRYQYRLLAATELQSTRDILPATLGEGDEQAQSSKLAKGDDDWFRPTGRRQSTLGQ